MEAREGEGRGEDLKRSMLLDFIPTSIQTQAIFGRDEITTEGLLRLGRCEVADLNKGSYFAVCTGVQREKDVVYTVYRLIYIH